MKHPITQTMKKHYAKTFKEYGCTSEGVDWGKHEDRALLRHQNISKLISKRPSSILDVGCGYGAFLDFLGHDSIEFTGIDVVPEMIDSGRARHPGAEFICDDFLQHDFSGQNFDYVVCNGIFTQKLHVSENAMEAYIRQVISKMFEISTVGIAFNMMTSYVNFRAENLYYSNPSKTLSWVMDNITKNVELNHAYPLYEYVVIAYHENVIKNLQGT